MQLMGFQVTAQSIQEVTRTRVIPAIFLSLGLTFLGYGAFVAIQTLSPAATVEALPVGEFVPGEVMIKFAPGAKSDELMASALRPDQTIYVDPATQQTVSVADQRVKANPGQFEKKKLRLTVRSKKKAFDDSSPTEAATARNVRRRILVDSQAVAKQIGLDRWVHLRLPRETDLPQVIARFETMDAVQVVEPVPVFTFELGRSLDPGLTSTDPGGVIADGTPNDPYYASYNSWGQQNSDQWGLDEVGMSPVFNRTYGDPSVRIAIIDTGVDYLHPDLGGCLGTNCRVVGGYNFYDNTTAILDLVGHGTHVAGIAAATTNNAVGIASPCGRCSILAYKVSDRDANISADALLSALRRATDDGADVINLSLGGSTSQALIDALTYVRAHNVVVVKANGNDSADSTPVQDALPNMVWVAGWDEHNDRALFSNFGLRTDVTAPATNILSLRAQGTDMALDASGTPHIVNENYYWASGTSMAAPLVSGIAGVLLSIDPSLTPDDVESILQQTAEDKLDQLFDIWTGYGLVRADVAVDIGNSSRPDVAAGGLTATVNQQQTQTRIRALAINYGERPLYNVSYTITPPSGVIAGGNIYEILPGASVLIDTIIPTQTVGQVMRIAVDAFDSLHDRNRSNNEVSATVQSNLPPAISPIPPIAIAEGQEMSVTIPATDANGDLLTFGFQQLSGPTAIPTNGLNTQTGVLKWIPSFLAAGQYQVRFSVSDGDVAVNGATVTINVSEASPPGFMTVIPGQGFAESIPEGRMVTDANSPDATFCQRNAGFRSDRCGLADTNWYTLGRYGIPISDVQYIRVRFNPNGAWDASPAANTSISDRATVRKEGGTYVFDLLPNIRLEPYVDNNRNPSDYTVPTFSTLRFVEQDDQGRNFGALGYAGWNHTWDEWTQECVHGASSPSFDKDGLGVRVFSSGTQANSVLTYVSFCFFDDSGGDIQPSWSAEVHLRSLNVAPNFTTSSIATGEHLIVDQILVQDLNQDQFSITAAGVPSGATLNPITGRFQWTPSAIQAGTYQMTVYANDGVAPTVSGTITITVAERNQPPVWVVPPPSCRAIAVPGVLSFTMSAADPNGQTLTYVGGTGPSGTDPLPAGSALSANGTFTWNMLSTAQTTTIVFSARDPFGAAAQQSTFIIVNGSCGSGSGGGDTIDSIPGIRRPKPGPEL